METVVPNQRYVVSVLVEAAGRRDRGRLRISQSSPNLLSVAPKLVDTRHKSFHKQYQLLFERRAVRWRRSYRVGCSGAARREGEKINRAWSGLEFGTVFLHKKYFEFNEKPNSQVSYM